MPIRTFGGGVQSALAGQRAEQRAQQELEAQIARSEALTGQGDRQLGLQESGLQQRLLQAMLDRELKLAQLEQQEDHFNRPSGSVLEQTGTQRGIAGMTESGRNLRHGTASGDTRANIAARAALQDDEQEFEAPEQQSRIGLRGLQGQRTQQEIDNDPGFDPQGVNALANLAEVQDVMNPGPDAGGIPFLGPTSPGPDAVSTLERARQLTQGAGPELGQPVKVDVNRPETIQRASELFQQRGFSPEQVRLLLQDPASIEEILGGQ